MSTIALTWAYKQTGLTAPVKGILCALAHHHNNLRQQCNPTVEMLMEDTEWSRRTICSAIAELAQRGLLTVQPGHGSKHNAYHLAFDAETQSARGANSKVHVTTQQGAPHAQSDETQSARGATQSARGATQSARGARASIYKQERTGKNRNITTTTTEHDPIFESAQNVLGLLNPTLAENLKNACQEYGDKWVLDALEETAVAPGSARRWNYTAAILRRWEQEGRQSPKPSKNGARSNNGRAPPPSVTAAMVFLGPDGKDYRDGEASKTV